MASLECWFATQNLAVECNVDPENTFVMENGEILEVSRDKAHVSGRVASGVILIDSSRAFEIDESIVEQRQHIAEDGMVMMAMSIDQSSKLLAGPDVSLRGLILPKGVPAEEFVIKVQAEAKAASRGTFRQSASSERSAETTTGCAWAYRLL